jgi:hypothetical protein
MAKVELRCDKRLHAILTGDGVLEVACRSALCGHRDGIVVIHRFDVRPDTKDDDRFIGTRRYRDTNTLQRKGPG